MAHGLSCHRLTELREPESRGGLLGIAVSCVVVGHRFWVEAGIWVTCNTFGLKFHKSDTTAIQNPQVR